MFKVVSVRSRRSSFGDHGDELLSVFAVYLSMLYYTLR